MKSILAIINNLWCHSKFDEINKFLSWGQKPRKEKPSDTDIAVWRLIQLTRLVETNDEKTYILLS